MDWNLQSLIYLVHQSIAFHAILNTNGSKEYKDCLIIFVAILIFKILVKCC